MSKYTHVGETVYTHITYVDQVQYVHSYITSKHPVQYITYLTVIGSVSTIVYQFPVSLDFVGVHICNDIFMCKCN